MSKVVYAVCSVTVLVLLVFTGVQSYRVSTLNRLVGQYKSDIADARRANERYADAYRQAAETNTELGECLSEHVSTLSQLREQLEAVRGRYEKMQEILEDLAGSGDSGNRSD